ncbi:ComF family protein [Candidatus Parcubacteria bacterium]|nr:ComF family protein [Candidatus Parcubacteria bacterium]
MSFFRFSSSPPGGVNRFFARLVSAGFDLLFPRACLGCGAEGTWLCRDCALKLPALATLTCLVCGRRRPDGRTYKSCRAKVRLTGTVAALPYADPLARELIHELKYGGIKEVADILAERIVETLRRLGPWLVTEGMLVPVPLHRRRERERTFNQAELIAEAIAAHLNLRTARLLRRIRWTPSQIELRDPALRRQNVAGAFAITPNHTLPRRVLLVDDVATTGATLDACAQVLRQAGVREVWGVVVAR